MFCGNCGSKAVEGNRFCSTCGQALRPASASESGAAEAVEYTPPVDQAVPVTQPGEKPLYCTHSASERNMLGVDRQHGSETCLGCKLPYAPGSPGSRLRTVAESGQAPIARASLWDSMVKSFNEGRSGTTGKSVTAPQDKQAEPAELPRAREVPFSPAGVSAPSSSASVPAVEPFEPSATAPSAPAASEKTATGGVVVGVLFGGAVLLYWGWQLVSGFIGGGSGGDGTFRVPQDMTPGLYHASSSSLCYYARLEDAGGNGPIITNGNVRGELTVEIKPSDGGFKSSGCGKWEPVTRGSGPKVVTFGDGIWLAGTDIAPGTYQSPGRDSCYWAVVDPGMANIFSNDNTSGPAVVDVSDGQSLESQGCGTWTQAQ